MSEWSYRASKELSDEQYARWQSLLEERTGISFFNHKSILQKGLIQRMREIGVDDYEQYFNQVSAVPEGVIEWTQLVDRISVKETSFFRDTQSYHAIRDYLQGLLQHQAGNKPYALNMWSVGCSTGEEAYSLAITAEEISTEVGAKVLLGVTGTDISQSALIIARQGRYTKRRLDAVDIELREKYFDAVSERMYQVKDNLRAKTCFVAGNALELYKLPYMAMDVICCQNILIYFRKDRRHFVLDMLIQHLKPGGLLVASPSEAIGWKNSQVRRTMMASAQAYIKC